MKTFLLIAALLFAPLAALAGEEQIPHLQEISVTIKANGSQGSGVLFTRKDGNDTVTFVWTAAHVVDGLRRTRSIVDPATGTPRIVVEFQDAGIVQEFTQNGRRIGEYKMDAQVIRYSDAETGEDLALLRVRKRNFTTASAVFYLDEAIPPIGTPLYHVGSLLGQVGANSLTTGVISQIGRVLDLGPAKAVLFDQTTATAFPGSSGGGVFFQKDGRYLGMLVRGAGEGFNFIVPARRLVEWAESAKVKWAVDPSVALPTEAEFKKLPVEDSGYTFEKGYSKAAADAQKAYPFLIKRESEPTPAEAVLRSILN